jgi:hypothetical protein
MGGRYSPVLQTLFSAGRETIHRLPEAQNIYKSTETKMASKEKSLLTPTLPPPGPPLKSDFCFLGMDLYQRRKDPPGFLPWRFASDDNFHESSLHSQHCVLNAFIQRFPTKVLNPRRIAIDSLKRREEQWKSGIF